MFKITPTAIDFKTPVLFMAELVRMLCAIWVDIAGAEVLLCGASYRQDVGDTDIAAARW